MGYIQAALMINNPARISVDRVSTKDNVVTDKISRVHSEANLASEMITLCP